eukprot:6410734-Prymnesium_polylepis.1
MAVVKAATRHAPASMPRASARTVRRVRRAAVPPPTLWPRPTAAAARRAASGHARGGAGGAWRSRRPRCRSAAGGCRPARW